MIPLSICTHNFNLAFMSDIQRYFWSLWLIIDISFFLTENWVFIVQPALFRTGSNYVTFKLVGRRWYSTNGWSIKFCRQFLGLKSYTFIHFLHETYVIQLLFHFCFKKTRNLEGEDATLNKIKHSKRVNLSQPCLTGKEDKRIESLPQIQVF